MTPPGVENVGQSLTLDGKKLAFAGNRAGKWDLWEKSLVDGHEVPIVADDYNRYGPRWSRDGTRLAYIRELPNRRPAYDLVQPDPHRRATYDAQRDLSRGVGLVS